MSIHITFPRDHLLPPGNYLISCTGNEEWVCAPVRHGAARLRLGDAVAVDVVRRPVEYSEAAELPQQADEAINALDHEGATAAYQLRAAALLSMCWIVGRTIGIDTAAWRQAGDLPRLCLEAVIARERRRVLRGV
ncbi:hypothetical protein [Actinopolymorpha singaporensis]|uniref:Uncharacterized protein n=1 Tax=Actinopolymorpha singaporensis TaxID=117157 RepID=A0A1H1U1W9_9ACTN|nr:hypothetical protein [Actinopolymorpha singaporensis]SDS66383.1 hypothetical protein SAMN04489717_3429 [Actinopolymorpha singaporensis]